MIYARISALAAYDAAHYRFARTQSRALAMLPWDRPGFWRRFLPWWLQ